MLIIACAEIQYILMTYLALFYINPISLNGLKTRIILIHKLQYEGEQCILQIQTARGCYNALMQVLNLWECCTLFNKVLWRTHPTSAVRVNPDFLSSEFEHDLLLFSTFQTSGVGVFEYKLSALDLNSEHARASQRVRGFSLAVFR